MPRRIDSVRIQVGDQLIDISWKTSQQLRGLFVGAGHHSIARTFAHKGTSAPIVLESAEKEHLLVAARVCMQTGNDEQARELLPLRNALQTELESQ
jgi:hypothetical protein